MSIWSDTWKKMKEPSTRTERLFYSYILVISGMGIAHMMDGHKGRAINALVIVVGLILVNAIIHAVMRTRKEGR